MTPISRPSGFLLASSLAVVVAASAACTTDEAPVGNAETASRGGAIAKPNEFAATVDLWTSGHSMVDPEFQQSCSGALIHPRVVLTAAHCTGPLTADEARSSDGQWQGIRIRTGGPALDAASLSKKAFAEKTMIIASLRAKAQALASATGDASFSKKYDALIGRLNASAPLSADDRAQVAGPIISRDGITPLAIRMPPGFTHQYATQADVALILLPTAVTSLPVTRLSNTPLKDGETLVFAGYGLDSTPSVDSSQPAPRQMKLVRNTAIVTALRTVDRVADPTKYFGALFEPSKAAKDPAYGLSCHGDSGGPVYRVFRDQHAIVGVVSRPGSAGPEMCVPGKSFAGVFTRTDAAAVQAWVTATLKGWKL